MKNDLKIIQIHAVVNFFLAIGNLSLLDALSAIYNKVERPANLGETEGGEAFDLAESCNWNIVGYLSKANNQQQGQLIAYICENYKGISVDAVERYYISELEKA